MKKGNYVTVIILSCLCSALISNWVINPQKANAAAGQKTRIVRATRFELLDSSGKTRATLGFDDEEKATVLAFQDVTGKQTLEMKSSQDASALLMKIADDLVLGLAVQPEGGGVVMLNDQAGKPGLFLNGGGEGGLIMVYDKDGNPAPVTCNP